MKSPAKMPPAWVYHGAQIFFKLLGWLLLKQEVRGRENLPAKGPFLLVFNHLSMVDAPVIFIQAPRQMVGMMTDKYSDAPLIAFLGNLLGIIWVARGEADMAAIKTSLGHLRSGGILAIAPEGTRNPEGRLQKGKTGAAYLADRAGVPIVTLGIAGTEQVFHNVRRLRRTPVKVTIGQPFHLPAGGRAKGETLEEYTDLIMRRLAEVLPPEYRGYYADAVQ
jgi:1-acyl-sn-glycerol-3-phosphate acyltransferase